MNQMKETKSMQDIYVRMRALFGIALISTLFIELLNRRSFTKLFEFIAYRPWMFLYDAMILLCILSFGMLFRRRRAATLILLLTMLLLAFVNFMVIQFRMQPFTTMDFLMIKDGLDIMPVYFNIVQIALIFIGIGSLLTSFAVIMVKARRDPRTYFFRKLIIVVAFGLCLLGINWIAVGSGAIERRFSNLVSAYEDYGFTYCFTRTFANMGIAKPSRYSGEVVEEIVNELGGESAAPTTSKRANTTLPNIIYVQLESHFDVYGQLMDTEFSENPIPVFTRLMENWPSGTLGVPAVGGGTANTEFEILSGMNLDYFGAGEYPYNTVLNNTTCESICYNLRAHGYASTALHNYLGTFYGRNTIYSQLGFDTFVPLEYMEGLEYNRQGWARDEALIGEIFTAIDVTPTRDFIMAITVQSHGKYLDTLPEEGSLVEVLSCPENINPISLQNFVNELYEVDLFIEQLLAQLENLDEPTVVVLYGDHLPALGFETSNMAGDSIYQTSYVIWNNYGAEFEAPDLQAYRLTANVLGQLGIDTGILTRFHQAFAIDEAGEEYLELLEILEYDMLYGDHESTGGIVPYVATDIKLGTREIRIADVRYEDGKMVVSGENFTESSVIVLDRERLETAFVTSEILVAVPENVTGERKISVAQITKENIELGRTEAFSATFSEQEGEDGIE